MTSQSPCGIVGFRLLLPRRHGRRWYHGLLLLQLFLPLTILLVEPLNLHHNHHLLVPQPLLLHNHKPSLLRGAAATVAAMAAAVSPLAVLAAAAFHLAVAVRAPAASATAVGAAVASSSAFPSPLVLPGVVLVWNTSRIFPVALELVPITCALLGDGMRLLTASSLFISALNAFAAARTVFLMTVASSYALRNSSSASCS